MKESSSNEPSPQSILAMEMQRGSWLESQIKLTYSKDRLALCN